jgi:hypothetical protein
VLTRHPIHSRACTLTRHPTPRKGRDTLTLHTVPGGTRTLTRPGLLAARWHEDSHPYPRARPCFALAFFALAFFARGQPVTAILLFSFTTAPFCPVIVNGIARD